MTAVYDIPTASKDKSPSQPSNTSPRILVIRRDNIGDLVCTTPLIRALRERFPNAWIGAMVNSYNAPVLDGNDDLDGVYVYTKAKHRAKNESLIAIFWQRWKMMRQLRAIKIDDVIVATTSPQPRVVKMARWLKPKRIIAYGNSGADIELPIADTPQHEVEDVFRSGEVYGIRGTPPACKVVRRGEVDPNRIAIHISARKPSQRWPQENFVALLRELHAQHQALSFMLLWSPGNDDDPRHPGDDAKAAAIIKSIGTDFPITAQATKTLPQLIATLSTCSSIICADGGAMHLAAGLRLSVVALFGDSNVERWRPWQVPQEILQTRSRNIMGIPVAEVTAAFNALRASTQVPTAQDQP